MEESVQEVLSSFGKDFENEEVLDKIENLRAYHNYTSSHLAGLLLTYLNSENIMKSTLSSEIIDNFEKQNSMKHVNEAIKISNKLTKSSEVVVKSDIKFLEQYLDENMDITMFNHTDDISSVDNNSKFKEINWSINLVNNFDYKIMYQKNVELCNVIEKQGVEVCRNQLKLWNESQNDDEANQLDFDNLSFGVSRLEEAYISGSIKLDHSQMEMYNIEDVNILQLDDEYHGIESIINKSEKLTPENIAIQGFSEQRMKLESLVLDQTESYSFFPGQNVIIKGKNPSQSGFHVQSVLPRFANPTAPINNDEILGDLRVVIACGPFTNPNNNDIAPLKNLMNEIKTNRCHVLILIGPIVDISNAAVQESDERFEKICWDRLKYIAKCCVDLHTHLIVVPSIDDATEKSVFPQPAFVAPSDGQIFNDPHIHFAPNPAVLSIGPYKFGVCSTDILRHLSTQEISKNYTTSRLNRLCGHILAENNFYPLKKTHLEVDMDWSLWYKNCGFGLTIPHCLILPSKLNTFIENVNGAVCINPGFLKKENHKSTYCRLDLSKLSTQSVPIETILDAYKCKIVVCK